MAPATVRARVPLNQVAVVPGGDGGGAEAERIHRRLQDQVQQTVQPHLCSVTSRVVLLLASFQTIRSPGVQRRSANDRLGATRRTWTQRKARGHPKHTPRRSAGRLHRTTLEIQPRLAGSADRRGLAYTASDRLVERAERGQNASGSGQLEQPIRNRTRAHNHRERRGRRPLSPLVKGDE
jgi:hypothetical protein